jgi:hypothetical protein
VVELLQPPSPAPAATVARREFGADGRTGEAPLEPAAGEIARPDLGEEAAALSSRRTQLVPSMRRGGRPGREAGRDRGSPTHSAVLELQRLAGNGAVVELLQPHSLVPTSLVVQREFGADGQTGEAPLEPAAGEIVQPDLGGEAAGAEPVAASTNEFGDMDGSIDTDVAPHAFLNKGQVATSKWHHAGGGGGKGNQGVGSATLVAPIYDSAPPRKAGGDAKAKVRKGTGKVTVKRSYNGVVPGDNGTAAWAGSGGGGVFIMWNAVVRIAKHEGGHIKETKKFHDTHIKPLESRIKNTRKAASEADAVAALQTHVDWNASVSSFATADTAMNAPGGVFDTTDQAKADFYHDKGPKKIAKKAYAHLIEAP